MSLSYQPDQLLSATFSPQTDCSTCPPTRAAWSGVLSTAGGCVYRGWERTFTELDAVSGNILWHFQTGDGVDSSPMAFAGDGKEYIGFAARIAVYTFGLP